jgi:hypothetical protein
LRMFQWNKLHQLTYSNITITFFPICFAEKVREPVALISHRGFGNRASRRSIFGHAMICCGWCHGEALLAYRVSLNSFRWSRRIQSLGQNDSPEGKCFWSDMLQKDPTARISVQCFSNIHLFPFSWVCEPNHGEESIARAPSTDRDRLAGE